MNVPRWLREREELQPPGRTGRQRPERIDTILERVPHAVKQAHERIIGERPVANEEKILSWWEGHAVVDGRGRCEVRQPGIAGGA